MLQINYLQDQNMKESKYYFYCMLVFFRVRLMNRKLIYSSYKIMGVFSEVMHLIQVYFIYFSSSLKPTHIILQPNIYYQHELFSSQHRILEFIVFQLDGFCFLTERNKGVNANFCCFTLKIQSLNGSLKNQPFQYFDQFQQTFVRTMALQPQLSSLFLQDWPQVITKQLTNKNRLLIIILILISFDNLNLVRMMKAQSTKSEQLAKVRRQNQNNVKHYFWCHSCQHRFGTNLNPGVDQILCPKCDDDFCELFTHSSHPNHFEPYQKPPKSHPRKIPKLTSQIVLMALAQLQYDSYAEKVRTISIVDIQSMKTTVELQLGKQLEECIICKEEMEIGTQALKCPCLHSFHVECLSQWLEYKNSCPKCRQKVLFEND